jgi:hypothetical protein
LYSDALVFSPRPSLREKVTFVEGIETEHFDLKVPVKGHLPVNIFAKGSLTGSRPTSYTNDDPLNRFLDDAIFSDFEEMLHEL